MRTPIPGPTDHEPGAGDPALLGPVSYGAVGATQAPDLLSFPPAGFRAVERSARIGHGEARWEYAVQQVLSWGVKRQAGFQVERVDPRVDDDELLQPGDTAVLHFASLREPVRVVYVVDEPRRRGFGYGTLPGHPLEGEESFIVEYRDDNSVWLTVRSFSRPSPGRWRALRPVLRIAQEVMLRRYLGTLAGKLPR
jgi:uncharacterized protein (UPF0548 family)